MGSILRDKVTVVTGSGRGIGRAHALTMAAQGAKVVINDPGVDMNGEGEDRCPADKVVAEIKQLGGEAVANYDSVATPEGAFNIIKTAIDNFGRLDILVNNAGIFGEFRFICDISDEEFDKMLKTHLYGHFYCAREAMRIFYQQNSGGRIINTASTAGIAQNYGADTGPRNTHYSSAKEAIVGLTRSLASEVTGSGKSKIEGVTVNCIRPGASTRIITEKLFSMLKDQAGLEQAETKIKQLTQQAPPEAISPLVVFLASDAASNVNGCVFYVSEGEVSIFRDPPYKEQSLWKKGLWTPEELVELLPNTLTKDKIRKYS
jgi:NAD(P)-dependent dehydrogenase (short-subunit alcohol dehydrogenase family)